MATFDNSIIQDKFLLQIMEAFKQSGATWRVKIIFTDLSSMESTPITAMGTEEWTYSTFVLGGTVHMGFSDDVVIASVTAGKTLDKIQLIYDDGSDTIMHEDTSPSYTFVNTADFVLTSYTVTYGEQAAAI